MSSASSARLALLVTGTDTGVGKTVIAAALLLASRAAGRRALGFKPAESGVSADEPADSEILVEASGEDEPLARPLLRLAEPLTPALAAERAGVRLDHAVLLGRIDALRALADVLVVEGAGGLLAPLDWGFTALDLAARARLDAVVVAHAGLGTLNHTLLTVGALRDRGVSVRGVVLNGRGMVPTLAEQTNPAALERLLPDVPIVSVPRHAAASAGEAARLSAALVACLLPRPTSSSARS